MPAQTNTNVSPYYDDFNPNDNFYRVLYKAGYPVQARELTQSQSILQDQIEKLGSRLLKDGDNVVPGEFSLGNPIAYVRASSITVGSTVDEYVGYKLRGVTSGVIATVNFATALTVDDDVTFYLNYESSGETSEYTTFIEGETLESTHPNLYTATVGVTTISKPIDTSAIGQGSLYTVTGGSYFVNGFIVRNDAQTIALEKYNTSPTYEVGFLVEESFVTSSDDESLLDNSQGSSNFAAPGADRLRITLELHKRVPGATDPNFIQLSSIQNGNILGKPDQTVKWDWLYDILAKRTFDESGNYIVQDFSIDRLEYYNTEDVEGIFDADIQTGLYPPVPGSDNPEELTQAEADVKYALKVGAGRAYVQGYQVGYNQPLYVYGDKPRDKNFIQNTLTQITTGYNINITNVYGAPDVQCIDGDGVAEAFDDVILYRNFTDGYVGESTDVTGRPLNTGNKPWVTYHIIADGDIGSISQHSADSIVFQDGNSCVVTSSTEVIRGDSIGSAEVLISNRIEPVPSGVMKPRYLTPNQRVDNQDGTFGYNSTYNLGIMTSAYFTELFTFAVDEPDVSWVTGDLVFGEESGAIGLVEEGSTELILLVSNVIGEFIPGEEVVQGTKVSRIMKEGEVYSFQFPTTGDLSAATNLTVKAIGSSIVLDSGTDFTYDATINSLRPTEDGREKLLNFPYPAGSELNVRINLDVETDNGVLGYAVTLDSKITNTLSKTKSVFSPLVDVNDFGGDISVQNNNDAEIVDIANRSLFSGSVGASFITCDNLSGDPTEQLVAGDVVTFVDDEGLSVSKLVLFATRPVGYGELRSKSRIYFTTTIPNKVTGKTVQRVRVQSQGSPQDNLLFQLPKQVISSLESDPQSTRISYQVYREHILDVNTGATTFTLTTNKPNEVYIADPNKTVITVSQNVSSPSDPDNFEGKSLTATISLQDNGRKAVFTFNNQFVLPDDFKVKVLAPVFVTNAQAKRKILLNDQQIIIDAVEATQEVISLRRPDVYAVSSIKMLNPGGLDIDVTDNYFVDDGQRDNIYQIARLILKPGVPVANEQLTITYDFFEHTNDGDFFSVDSYTHDGSFNYGSIPLYVPNVSGSNTTDVGFIYLSDCVDFRPVVNATGNSATIIPTITDGRSQQGAVNFNDSTFAGSNPGSPDVGDAFVPRIPISGTQFQCDIEYYLPKIDSLFLDKDGSLNLVSGTAADNPLPPPDLVTAIRLYDIHLPQYTFSIQNARVQKFNYKVYRMKDIADMNRRIDRIEELVTLSLLEQSALNMSVRDAVTGLERFKNGIVVDTFRDHTKGNINSSQYRNSIDNVFTHLRAAHFTDQVELETSSQTEEEMLGNGFKTNNGIVTCNFENVRIIQNPLATRFINLQPYTVFTYDGNLELTPSVDTWQVTNRLPDLVIEDNNLFNAFVGFSDEMAESGIGTQWGEWETTGTTSTSTSQNFVNKAKKGKTDATMAAVAIRASGGNVNVNKAMQERLDKGKNIALKVTSTTTATTSQREQTATRINVGTARVEQTSYGDRVVDVKLADTMRSVPVIFQAYRLKPNTRYYFFFDEIEVTNWCSPDTKNNDFPDGLSRYTGSGGTTNSGFGLPLISDDVGTLSGVFLIPSGRAPLAGSRFTSTDAVEYETSGTTRSFHTGTRKVRITSSPLNVQDLSQVEGFAEANFYAQGVFMDKQETIVSTRIPDFSHTTTVIASETKVETSTKQEANYFDPVAQTFLIDKNNADGVFVTELDIFFRTKDPTQGVEAYLVSTDGQVPTENILPHSLVVKNTDTTLRVVCELGGTGLDAVSIPSGTTVVGSTSGSTGTIKSVVVFEPQADNPTTNVTNHVYNVLLDNYTGEFVAGETLVPNLSPAVSDVFTVVSDEFEVTRIDIMDLGTGYDSSTVIEFSAPELPGGVTATGELKIGPNGEVYKATLINPGSGYIRVPSATIIGSGSDAEVKIRAKAGIKAVDMGVSTSEDATAATKFKFKAPVYLLGDTNYAFVVKAPTSLAFTIWTSKLGENLLGTDTRVIEQPNMGSLFMSQNGALWTEDQTQDVTFRLWRAEFDVNTTATVKLQNTPLLLKPAQKDAIETSSVPASDPDSVLFGDNPQIIRVFAYNHGLAPDDLVAIEGVVGTPGGIPDDELNNLHTVINSTMNSFTIKVTTPATASGKNGGNNITCSYNRPFEVLNVVAGAMIFGTSRFGVQNRTTECAGLSAYNAPFQYRLDTPVDINLMETFYYPGAKQVANSLNESKYNSALYLQGRRSMETTVSMSTINSKVSPVIDLDRTNATVVRNLIDNPQPDDPNFGPSARTVTFNTTLPELTKNSTITVDDVLVRVDDFNATTKKLKVSGHNASRLATTSTFSGDLESLGVKSVTASPNRYFIPETSTNGSVYAKWISRLFLFENACDGMEVKIASIFYQTDSVKLYFRPRNIGFDGDIADVNWIPFNGTGLPDDVDLITPRDSSNINPNQIFADEWQSLTWTVQDTAKFDGAAFKIVMTSDNPAHAPLIDDIQIVVSE